MMASDNGITDTVGILLEHGADINAKDEQGKLHTIIVKIHTYIETISIHTSINIHL